MNKINYNNEFEKIARNIIENNLKPKLLLHSCCAPCSSAVLERLTPIFDIYLYYYNPNIYPKNEYIYRFDELKKLVCKMPKANNIEILDSDYNPDVFFELVKGHESDPERGERCHICIAHRLEKSAQAAKAINADFFTTTLTIGPMKDDQYINAVGKALTKKYGVEYLFSDFKKKNGYKRSIELSHKYNLYRQNFCGCIYSKEQRIKN